MMNGMPRHLGRSIALAAGFAVCCGVFAAEEAPTTSPTTLPTTTPTTAPSSKPFTLTPAATQPAARQPVQFEKLLAALSSDDWKQRQQAADAMAELDTSFLPRLKDAVDAATDVDLRNTLLAAIKRLDERTLIGPSLITLNVKNAPAVDVVKALASQLSFDLLSDNTEWLNDVRVTLSADRKPFWAVMKSLSPQWPVRVIINNNDAGRLTLQSVGPNYLSERATVAGPFLICPISINTNSNADLLLPVPVMKIRMVTVQLIVLAEPKLHATRTMFSITEAVDENGKVLNIPDANGRNFLAMGSAVSTTSMTSVRFTPPPDAGKFIARLAGNITCRVPTRTKRTELTNTTDGKKHAVDLGGRQIDVTSFAHDKQYDVKLTLPMNINPQDELSQSQIRDMSLLDAAGNALFRKSFLQTMSGRNWEVTVTFAKEGSAIGRAGLVTGEPVKLVWDLPVETKEVQTPFEVKNIPLSQ
ncbi:hypothetical protein BH10PLA1_BH10PLA1_22430 [soil metagenome]